MKNQINLIRSVRKTWDFNPRSRVVTSKKDYSRKNKFGNKYDND